METTPKVGQEVQIKYTLKNSDNTVIDSTENRPPFSYIIGSNKVYEEIDTAIKTMKKGEKKEIAITAKTAEDMFSVYNMEKKGEIKLEIELVDFYDKIKSVFEMDTKEKKERALLIKEEGVKLFKEKDYKNAVEKFKEALTYIDKVNEHEMNEEIKTIKISLMLNACNCYNRLNEYTETIKMSENVIAVKNDNAKCYYYRGMANAYLDEFDKANEDYNKLIEILKDEKDPGVQALRQLIDTRKSTKESKEKAKYKNIFKQGLYN